MRATPWCPTTSATAGASSAPREQARIQPPQFTLGHGAPTVGASSARQPTPQAKDPGDRPGSPGLLTLDPIGPVRTPHAAVQLLLRPSVIRTAAFERQFPDAYIQTERPFRSEITQKSKTVV